MKEEYLKDATPCTECDLYPFERVEKCPPFYIYGVPLDGGYGTCLICGECGKKTSAHDDIQEAYREWNEKVNKEMTEGENADCRTIRT